MSAVIILLTLKIMGGFQHESGFNPWWELVVEGKKYVNIPSEKYIYVHIYVCICVYTYLCKMDERWSYASLS